MKLLSSTVLVTVTTCHGVSTHLIVGIQIEDTGNFKIHQGVLMRK